MHRSHLAPGGLLNYRSMRQFRATRLRSLQRLASGSHRQYPGRRNAQRESKEPARSICFQACRQMELRKRLSVAPFPVPDTDRQSHARNP